MPAQTRSRDKSTSVTYRSTPAAPKQVKFSYRRRSVKTYGRTKPARNLKQETLTQMNFTSSTMREYISLDDDDDDDDDDEKEEEEDKENKTIALQPPKLFGKTRSKANSRSSRRKTAGDELDTEHVPRQSKRRKTLGDSPNASVSSSFHTQTLTQMMSTHDKTEDIWKIEDSQDDEEAKLFVETPRKAPRHHTTNEAQESTESAVPSLIKSATPANRQKRTEIPSSQSPATPMLLRYSPAPQHSPLMTRSTNVAASSPILKDPRKTPRDAVIPDSYSTAHGSSPAPSQKSTVKATPSKRLRFDLPDDKENVTPGRTKPKSPKPKSQSAGRRPLQEVPDSDEEPEEDLDETEYETEDDEFGGHDPESPTPKRFRNVMPPVQNPEPELELTQAAHCALEEAPESVIPSGSRFLTRELILESCDEVSLVVEHEQATSPGSRLEEQNIHLEQPGAITESGGLDHRLDQETSTEVEALTPKASLQEQDVDVGTIEQTLEPAPLEEVENDYTADDLSPSQDYMYTQGLESQRLPLDSIRALGPQTPHSDIMVSLHPEHIARIVDRTKNHEFRVWKIPSEVSRIWVYITRPASQLKYMCLFSEPKSPGEIQDETGIGNIDFNQGKKTAKYAYEILQVYELNNPVPLDEMKRKGWVAGAPQKYTYIPPAVVGELTANLRCALFEESSESGGSRNQGASESQELKAQLQNDAAYSTQHYSGETDEVIPASQSPRKNNESSEGVTGEGGFARPALSRVRSISSNHGSPSLPSQRQRGFVRLSQATTVSQVSSSPVISPGKSRPRPIPLSSQAEGSSPAALRHTVSSLRSSQFQTRSQILPDSLLNDDFQEPPPIVWDSADEGSD
ncbi:hypothetical protein F4802DRAFT_564264 [Xylaria palmicola]|nr:hypothetical protein F4802DRAFT_564264 [Xylaria palmicola]